MNLTDILLFGKVINGGGGSGTGFFWRVITEPRERGETISVDDFEFTKVSEYLDFTNGILTYNGNDGPRAVGVNLDFTNGVIADGETPIAINVPPDDEDIASGFYVSEAIPRGNLWSLVYMPKIIQI